MKSRLPILIMVLASGAFVVAFMAFVLDFATLPAIDWGKAKNFFRATLIQPEEKMTYPPTFTSFGYIGRFLAGEPFLSRRGEKISEEEKTQEQTKEQIPSQIQSTNVQPTGQPASQSTSQPVSRQASQSTSQPTSVQPAVFVQRPLTAQIPRISVDTLITSGPSEGEIINETNDVVFKFQSFVYPQETQARIFFETKMEGFDKDWQNSYSGERRISLNPGPREYTFLVRARIEVREENEQKSYIDLTPAQKTFKINTSPYFGKIRISSINRVTSDVMASSIALYASFSNNETLDITGWRIEGKKGGFTIPQGIERYEPYYLALDNVFYQNIIVKSGDRIYLSGKPNPLGRGENFRPNKCFGYITNYYEFPIAINKDCPQPPISDLVYFEPRCQKFIYEMPRCQESRHWQNLGVTVDRDCIAYTNNYFNYNACFQRYSQDPDFLKNEWHIYMNQNITTWGFDLFYLKDKNGLVVDKYNYQCLWCE